VFPEPGAKDVRQAPEIFIRRYLTKGELVQIVRTQPPGWDIHSVRTLLKSQGFGRETESYENQKHGHRPNVYELITWYNSYGDPFLTFEPKSKMLLRIEKNKHPLKQHPV